MSTPTRQTITINRVSNFSPALSRVLQENEKQRKIKSCLKWGTLNLCFLFLILFDLVYTCSLYLTYTQMVEYFLVAVLSMNIVYYIFCYPDLVFKYEKSNSPSVTTPPKTSPIQRQISNTVSPFSTPGERSSEYSFLRRTPSSSSFSSTPINRSANSWRSTPGSMYFPYQNGSSPETQPVDNLLHPKTSSFENISDSETLSQYLSDFEEYDKIGNVNKSTEQTANLLSTFWNYPSMKSVSDISSIFRRTQYQLSFMPTLSSSSPSSNSDDKGSPQSSLQNLEIWKQINVDMHIITRWTGNLRAWISKTILERIMKEIDSINEKLEKNGLTDMCIGQASLDGLRKISQTAVIQFVPTLPTLIPFLEVTSNQEYLIKRIRDLGKSGCMSDFKWKSGSSFKGKEWNDSLPTDSEIIMHLFVSYMDTQLAPLPSKPDAKPFSSSHFIRFSEKNPELPPNIIAIRECSVKPPQYQVIVGDKLFEFTKGHNNLFHTILLFLYHVNSKEHGMLGGVNLGRSGVNMLWIIQN